MNKKIVESEIIVVKAEYQKISKKRKVAVLAEFMKWASEEISKLNK